MYSRYHFRLGPVADPGPEPWGPWPPWGGGWQPRIPYTPEADPVPAFGDLASLIDKASLAKLRVKQLDHTIQELEGQLEMMRMVRDTLAKEHGVG